MRTIFASLALCATLALAIPSAPAATVIDDWSSIKAPTTPPPVAAVKVDAPTTALLMLDFVKQTCGGPRCTAALPAAAKLLQTARAGKMLVVYSYLTVGTLADTAPAVAPLGGEPTISTGPDKFVGSDLQQILTQKGIKTVIVAGTAANGAVLYTASHAALLGLDVVVPVDAMPNEVEYAEQYVVWKLVNAPRVSAKVKLTTAAQVSY